MTDFEKGKRTPLLFLCHRIPYPPNKGDKIRAFHLLHHLSREFDIYLASFVDDPLDWEYVTEVEKYCSESLIVPLKKWSARAKSLAGLVTGKVLSVPFYRSKAIQQWVDRTVVEKQIRHTIVYSSVMAQYVMGDRFDFTRRIVDFVDVDSDKWWQYSERSAWPLSLIYKYESRVLLEFERSLAADFDVGLFVSEPEAQLFCQKSPETAHKIGYYNNGVNFDYFDPALDYTNPYPSDTRNITFTGAMDYWPNIDAVKWFSNEVMPLLRRQYDNISFYIVGSSPTKALRDIASEADIFVTGRVDDIRPYIIHADVIVAPMNIARGVQNKVLEAMSMGSKVVVSTAGLEGIDARHDEELLIADSAADYCEQLTRVFDDQCPDMGDCARTKIINEFSWDSNLPEIVYLLKEPPVYPLLKQVSDNA